MRLKNVGVAVGLGLLVGSIEAQTVERSTLRLDWTELAKGKPSVQRVKSGELLSVEVGGFNFLHYSLTLQVDERQIESYSLLSDLWAEVLGLGDLAASTAAPTSAGGQAYEEAAREWLFRLELGRKVVEEADAFHPRAVGLDKAATEALQQLGERAGQALKELAPRRARAHAELLAHMSHERWLQYRQIDETHEAVAALLGRIGQAGRLARDRQVQVLGVRKPGTLLTITAHAKARDGSGAQQVGPIEVFVESRFPLHFHAGLVYTDRTDIEFEKVRNAAGADVFQEIAGPSGKSDLTALMTYEAHRFDGGALGLTLGTRVDEPGAAIYLGGTVRMGRVGVTVGKVSTLGDQGVDLLAGEVAGRAGVGKLYSTYSRTRTWATFIGLSFSVFP